MYTINKQHDGSLVARCQIQDGSEIAVFNTVDEAVKWLIGAARTLNNQKIIRKSILFGRWTQVIESKLVPWDGKE